MKANVGDHVRVVDSIYEEEGGPFVGDIGTVTEHNPEGMYPYRVRFDGFGCDNSHPLFSNGPEGLLFLTRELEDWSADA